MFQKRQLSDELRAVRDEYAPETLVVDADADFETIPPAAAEDLGLLADSLDPATYPSEWIPEDSPVLLQRYAGGTFTIGMPGDGTIVWTRQTSPPTVIAKKRAEGTPEAFLEFLFAEAFVQIHLDAPEHFLPFFGERYRELDGAVSLTPAELYQVAAALYEGWLGVQSREVFAAFEDDYPDLYDGWLDAGTRLEGRIEGLPGEVARGDTSFVDATELACSGLKHALELPAPFAALDTTAYRDHGAAYAVRWAEKTFAALRD
ncbi:hypothetical protein AUR64_01680 [Haloprofundus marisrubri]|uniref:Uncharacterized protein n=1 Tax=Haloprofundus marisrubri TaxID=1514971 RepID=A0A0W1R3D5_9EURY|nr:hypothetical protein [Haloprofundus marisrubri]KTG07969.1 hypothetical protein AUR64_01680 [Haloprofundus marisrubri]